jgi:signal transduction histidine kinase
MDPTPLGPDGLPPLRPGAASRIAAGLIAPIDAAPASDHLTAIVHELRNLLDGATRCVSLARREASRGPASSDSEGDMLRRLEAAETALQRMASVINHAMSPCAAPLLERFGDPRPLIEAILHAAEVHRPLADQSRIRLVLDCSPRLVLTQSGPMYAVLANGIRNALEAIGEDGSVEITAELVTPRAGGCEVHIDILDDGPGPTDEAVEHAFQLGFTTKRDGIGVGLALSQEIIHELGGWIALRPRWPQAKHGAPRGAHLMIRYPVSP